MEPVEEGLKSIRSLFGTVEKLKIPDKVQKTGAVDSLE